ncbi:alpha/beta fold hydrolase [Gordonia metallireducens]|uniref:alpha/beta fold hydrolase n=1 Tax=Gordonia metallireducens TaxID=2897779 RepID=UPI001E2E1C21|nr:alpha/beta fold hydrolase [Gordonia metallireducens]
MPGFGEARVPDGFGYSAVDYAGVIGQQLDELAIRTAHLVVHDFGGPWGLTWAADNPGRVGSVTLLNTGVWLGYRWHWAARAYRIPVVGELTK